MPSSSLEVETEGLSDMITQRCEKLTGIMETWSICNNMKNVLNKESKPRVNFFLLYLILQLSYFHILYKVKLLNVKLGHIHALFMLYSAE